MNFLFTWKHQDGSVVEFSEDGWKSNDVEKTKWLTQISDLCSSSPTFSPSIRAWLEAHCQLIAFHGPGETSSSNLERGLANRHASKRVRKKRAGASLQNRPTQPVMVSKRMIDSACDNFFRSRGMLHKESGNSWTRSSRTDRN
jgi:hypothetical protein